MSGAEDYAQELVLRARDDLEAARALLDVPAVSSAIVGFHAQQAVEKAFKAILVRHGAAQIPRSHNLAFLTQLLEDLGLAIPPSLDDVDLLTPFAVTLRYDSQPPLVLTRAQALAYADAAIGWADTIAGSPD